MAGDPQRLRWACALAALVGGVGGPFLVYWPASLGLASNGPDPLLGDAGATAVQVAFGPVVGLLTAGLATYGIGRNGHERAAAILGVAASVVALGLVGLFAEPLAEAWVRSFAADPGSAAMLTGGLAGGIAGALLGAGLATSSRVPDPPRGPYFVALLGSLVGLLVGLTAGQLGLDLAVMASVCPNGYFQNPVVPSGECSVGFSVLGLLLGAWTGAAAGAAVGGLSYLAVRRARGLPL